MPIFPSLDIERMLIYPNFFLWKSAIYHLIKLSFDAEVAKKFLNVIKYICTILKLCILNGGCFFPQNSVWKLSEVCILEYLQYKLQMRLTLCYIKVGWYDKKWAILKEPGPPLIWKGGPECLCRYFRWFLAPKILKFFIFFSNFFFLPKFLFLINFLHFF